MKVRTRNPLDIRRMKHSLAVINRIAMEWADKQGWNTPKAATVIESSFQCYDGFLLALLPVALEEAERGTCCVVKLWRDGTRELAFLCIFHDKRGGTETSALVELTEEQYMRAHVH